MSMMLIFVFAIVPGWITEQDPWQRVWAAKDEKSARNGMFLGSFLVAVVFGGCALIALGMNALYPEIAKMGFPMGMAKAEPMFPPFLESIHPILMGHGVIISMLFSGVVFIGVSLVTKPSKKSRLAPFFKKVSEKNAPERNRIEPEIGFLMFVPGSRLDDLLENMNFLMENNLLDRLDRTANLLSHTLLKSMSDNKSPIFWIRSTP